MKAILRTVYGPPNLLELGEIERPLPKDDELLIKVHAASVNPGDSYMVRGKPLFIRALTGGLFKPTKLLIGEDAAGGSLVDEVGYSCVFWSSINDW